ncbi:MAG: hypothetical protein HN413_00760 [Chloroflexi bacterium]|jgi:hypothetical protein|nr:hypothetical protein [Chloroflexota bacterium]
MIIRDLSPIPYIEGKLSVAERAKAIMQFGSSWPADMKSQEMLARSLARSLDNSHTLLRNLKIPEPDVIVPLILISPQGMTVLYNNPVRGVFRAQGNTWKIMSGSGRSFQAAKPNLILRTQLLTRGVETFLTQHGYGDLPLEGILVFTDSGTHVDTIRPDVRIVQLDALERFSAQLSSGDPVMGQERRFKLVEMLVQIADETQKIEEQAPTSPSAISDFSQRIDSGFAEKINPLQKRFNFSRQQWLILGAIVIAEVLILVGFLLLILFTA